MSEPFKSQKTGRAVFIGLKVLGSLSRNVDHSYLQEPIEESPEALDKMGTCPAAMNHIFKVNTDIIKLDEERHVLPTHQLVTKLLFVSTRARSDIHHLISFLTSRVEMADKVHWKKLKPLMQHIHCTKNDHSTKNQLDTFLSQVHTNGTFSVRKSVRAYQ
jgi:hypothetical protein